MSGNQRGMAWLQPQGHVDETRGGQRRGAAGRRQAWHYDYVVGAQPGPESLWSLLFMTTRSKSGTTQPPQAREGPV